MKKNTSLVEYFLLLNISPLHYNSTVFHQISFGILMSEQTIDLKKRRFLTKATSVVGAVGVGFAAWPFLSTWKPSAKAKAAGAPVDVDISKLEAGQLVRVLWRKKPVWIFKRDEKALESLDSEDLINKLADADGTGNSKSQQPDYVTANYRSIENKESVAVIVGVCTHLGYSQPIDQSLVQLILVETAGKAVFIARVMALNLTLLEEFMLAYLLQLT